MHLVCTLSKLVRSRGFSPAISEDFGHFPYQLVWNSPSRHYLVDVLDIFYFFFCSGEGKGKFEAPRRILKIPGGGGSPGGMGVEAGSLQGNWVWMEGGGGQIFFFGAEMPTNTN